MYSNWLGLQKTGQMHEKYDARHPGERGAGGEYKPQVSQSVCAVELSNMSQENRSSHVQTAHFD
jgi:hypothetical protein